MIKISPKLARVFLFVSSLVFCVALMAMLIPRYEASQHAAPDSKSQNKDETGPTADQQKMSRSDRDLTQMIRKALHRDRSLSHEAHNVRIFMQNGKVILRGPVRSEEEKSNVEGKAASAVGQKNVTNQLEVVREK
jgi:hyperosmotically inducible periplasmic protein